MPWPDDDAFALPQREGVDVGGAQERNMFSVAGGKSSIRTVEFVESDGTVTRLRTRGGWPLFEKLGSSSASSTVAAELARGFVAKVPGGRAVLFNPYTLAILDPKYTLAKNTYTLQDFATAWNVPAGDTTHWYDVVIFDGTTVKVNAKAMGSLLVTGNHGYPAIPYVINRNDASDQYGNAERNVTEKRVFAVGRYQVNSWGGGGTSQVLTPTTPRSDSKAMTIGQRLDFSTDKAWLGQLYYSGYAWDSIDGEWYFTGAAVTMLLASPYLSKVANSANVAMSPPALTGPTTSSGTLSVPTTLSPTDVALVAHATVDNLCDYPTTQHSWGHYTYDGTEKWAMTGTVEGPYTRDVYSGSSSSTEVAAGVSLDFSAANSKNFDVRTETTWLDTQTMVYLDASLISTNIEDMIANTADTLYWLSGNNPGSVKPYRGVGSSSTTRHSITASTCSRNYDDQTGAFSVSKGAEKLVDVSFVRNHHYGPKALVVPNTNYYDTWLGQDVDPGWGMGTYGGCNYHTDATSVNYYKNPGGYPADQSQSVRDEINAAVNAMAAVYCGQTMVTSEQASGVSRWSFSYTDYYWSSIGASVIFDDQTLTWSTKDYLLYDDTNGVYIWIEGIFSGTQAYGSNAAAGLTVNLKVQTRFHTNTQTVGTFTYSYSTLLPETQIGNTGKYAIPSPQIRAIFAPLYQEQGSFKGAHYVTQLEESNGADSFHGFNFLLKLRMYGDLQTVNSDNENYNEVYFVPCNLLEMLYCFVFSQQYGVGATRYPVDYTTRFNDMQSTLFTNAIRVSVRNGSAVNWTDSLGTDFAAISNTSLHRA